LGSQENALADERTLLREARSLDDSALGAVFDTYYPLLYRYIYHHVHHQATAEDLAGEVFARLLAHLAEGRGPKRHLRAWLYRVAHNLVVDESRRRVHRDHEPLDDWNVPDELDVEMQAQAALAWHRARAALEELSPKQRAVIILKFMEGYDNKEVSRILEISVGAVKSLQHRGLASMRRHLAQVGVLEEELA
jgi:RNA polymerase sigma-70 factor (ECF subfamily)